MREAPKAELERARWLWARRREWLWSPGWVDALHVVVGGIGFLLPVPWNLAALGTVTVSALVRAAFTVLSINGQRRWASDYQRALARLFSRK